MKNIIIGILIGLFLNGITCFAENIITNPFKKIGETTFTNCYTTKVNAPEGSYRIFMVDTVHGVGITAIKIN